MKINSHLKRSRHGVYYFRFIIPKSLRAQFNHKVEIKRSLGTKEHKLAHLCAYAISVKLLAGTPLITILNNSRQFISEIKRECMGFNYHYSEWTVKFPCGTELTVDPNNPKDLASGERIVKHQLEMQQASTNTQAVEERPTLSEKMSDWLQRLHTEKLRPKTIDEYQSKFLALVKYSNNAVIADFTAEQFSHFVDSLALGKVTGKPLSSATIDKYIAAANSFFDFCQRLNVWPKQDPLPTKGFRLGKHTKSRPTSHQPFTKSDLLNLFDASQLAQLKQPHQYWVPLIALFTGARLEEICQLNLSDIHQDDDGVWIFDFNDLGETKKLKTRAAHRKVPIHSKLLTHGLLDYVNFIQQHYANECQLFPYLTTDKYGKFSSNVSKWFARYLDKTNIKADEKVFHSFRSTFNNLLKHHNINEETRCQIVGHEHDSVNSRHYSEKHSNQWLLSNVFKKIDYQGLDLSAFLYDQSLLKPQLDQLIRSKSSKLKNKQAIAKKKT